MMGRLEQDQGQLFYSFCLEEVVPDDHQVRAIASVLDLSWVYGELSPHYPALGRPSIDPVLMIRMLIVGYVFAIRSERRLCSEVQVNLAYRWFCKLGIEDKIQGEMLRTVLKRLIIKITRLAKLQTANYQQFTDDKMDLVRKFNLLLEANRSLLEILVSNLLSNAIRHNFYAGTIEITLVKDRLIIANMGKPGSLDPKQIFRRFHKESVDAGSIGLGLEIVRKIGHLYGWTIEYAYHSGLHTFTVQF